MKKVIIFCCFIVVLAGCGEEEKKKQYYDYECILNSDCLPGQICINGQCEDQVVEDVAFAADTGDNNDIISTIDADNDARPDASQDAGQDIAPDIGDIGVDAEDAGADAGKDISQDDVMTDVDAGFDADVDAGEDVIDNDAGADAGDAITSDAIEDISADVGEDTGVDVIEDANVDSGPSDAGCSSCEIIFANPCGEAKDDFILRSIPDFRTVAEGECIAESCQIVFDCSRIGDYFQIEFSCEGNKKWLCNSWQNKNWIDPQDAVLRICGEKVDFEAVEAFGGGNCKIIKK